MLAAELRDLATEIDTATAHQSPTWADDLSLTQLHAVIVRAEQLAASTRATRNNMRKPG